MTSNKKPDRGTTVLDPVEFLTAPYFFFGAAFLAAGLVVVVAFFAVAFFTAATLAAAAAVFFAVTALRFARVLLLFATVFLLLVFPFRRVARFVVMLLLDLVASYFRNLSQQRCSSFFPNAPLLISHERSHYGSICTIAFRSNAPSPISTVPEPC